MNTRLFYSNSETIVKDYYIYSLQIIFDMKLNVSHNNPNDPYFNQIYGT